jgi:hypothetical protein
MSANAKPVKGTNGDARNKHFILILMILGSILTKNE